MNHQFLFQLSIFCRSFPYASLYTPSSFAFTYHSSAFSADLHFCSHSFILLSFLSIHFCLRLSSFFVHMLYRPHGLFEMIWCFFLTALSQYMRRISMYHTYYLICINQEYFLHSASPILAQCQHKIDYLEMSAYCKGDYHSTILFWSRYQEGSRLRRLCEIGLSQNLLNCQLVGIPFTSPKWDFANYMTLPSFGILDWCTITGV